LAWGGIVRVVICDSNRLLREALAAALEICDDDVTAVAAGSAGDCISAIVRDDAEVCVLDPHLPGAGDSVDVIREIRRSCPAVAVVVISELSAALIWAQAKELGIAGLLGKNRSVSEIAQMLHRIAGGEAAFDRLSPNGVSRPAAPSVLTPREAEVLRRIVAGQHTQQMAREMNIAISTLRTYIKNVFAKLGVHSRLEAAACASRTELPDEIPARPVSPQHQQDPGLDDLERNFLPLR
jgi:DNA-binding NarL/FixJ family response regulator